MHLDSAHRIKEKALRKAIEEAKQELTPEQVVRFDSIYPKGVPTNKCAEAYELIRRTLIQTGGRE